MNKIEITGKTINEAVEAGAKELGLDLTEIEYRVINDASKGFLGIGAKLAKVLVYKTGTDPDEQDETEVAKEEKKEEKAAAKEEKKEEKKEIKQEKKANPEQETKEEKEEEPQSERALLTEEDKAGIVKSAENFLNEVFSKMGVEVGVSVNFVDNKQIRAELTGADMGSVIGKRGQTLDSLQYLTNLVVNKGEYPYMNVTLDTEGYRERRKETLEKLALNLAKKAKHNRRNVTLEPMNPYERRIIHAALQNDKYVTTFSEGAEPYRYVVIALKNGYTTGRRYSSYRSSYNSSNRNKNESTKTNEN
ncbi:MAG: protein jag [Firmicutes bacterium]|nr:protein jag [Bacillota bacterium]